MLGAITADIIGSRFEFNFTKDSDIDFFHSSCSFTDDTVYINAINTATINLLAQKKFNSQLSIQYPEDYQHYVNYEEEKFALKIYTKNLLDFFNRFPLAGYSQLFIKWVHGSTQDSYNGLGNGSLVRAIPIVFLATNLDDAIDYSLYASKVTHNEPEVLSCVKIYAQLLWLVKTQELSLNELKTSIQDIMSKASFHVNTVAQYQQEGGFHILAVDTLTRAVSCFLEASSYEETIANVLYIGSDTDTIGAIAGALAEYTFGIPENYLHSLEKYFNFQHISLLQNITDSYLKKSINNQEFSTLARNNIFNENHLKIYQHIQSLVLEDLTAQWDPLDSIEEAEYYSNTDLILQYKQKNIFQKIYHYIFKRS